MYSKILVPIDGSATSKKALEEAVQLARVTGGSLRLLHVVDPLEFVAGLETASAYMHDLLSTLVRSGEEMLEKAKGGIEAGVSVDTELYESTGVRVSEAIVQRGQEWGAELIVLGTHGRRGIERVFMGSDAEQVVRIAPVPVLLVRHRD